MNKYMSATQARKIFFQLLRETAGNPGSCVTITLDGLPSVTMMSTEEFEGLMETLDIMSDPKLVQEIEEADRERDTVDWEDVKKKHNLA